MSDVVFQGAPGSVWNHFGGGEISRVSSYPFFGPAPFQGVAVGNGTVVVSGLTLPQTEPELLDQWLRVSKWNVEFLWPAGLGIEVSYTFELPTGRTATINEGEGIAGVTIDNTTPIDQQALLLGGVETRIEHLYDSDYEASVPRFMQTLALVIRHGEWAVHGPMSKWLVGIDLELEMWAMDNPEIPYDELSLVNQPDEPIVFDNCPSLGGYHWDGISGENLGNETDPAWTYICAIDYYSQLESDSGVMDPDMERADDLGIAAEEVLQIGTFMGWPMYVRRTKVVGNEVHNPSIDGLTITITAAEYYPLP